LSGFRKIGSQYETPDLGKWEVNGIFPENYGTFCTSNTKLCVYKGF
jgi:hypothetical protein